LVTLVRLLLLEIKIVPANGEIGNEITSEHLARGACVYIRQSAVDQLVHNQESQRSSPSCLGLFPRVRAPEE
jgi:hypothetical protein